MLAALVALVVSGANPNLEEGRALFEAMQYRPAEARLRLARSAAQSNPAERREILDLLARALAAQGRLGEAEDVYAELLAADPHAPSPDGVSPKITDAYQRAKERLYPRGFVRLVPDSPQGREVSVVDPWSEVAEVAVFSAAGPGEFAERRTKEKERIAAALPAGTQRWYVEAYDRRGKRVASAGSAVEPLQIGAALPAAAAPSAEIAAPVAPGPSRWPEWTVLGASVVAACAGVGFGLSAAEDYRAADAAFWGSESRQLGERGRGKAVAANLLIAGALVGAGTATAMWMWRW
jgi:hypothetical protein